MHPCIFEQPDSKSFSNALPVTPVIEPDENPSSAVQRKLGEGSRPDIEKEVMPVLQSQKAADEITDDPPMGKGNDGPGGIGGDPSGNRPDPFTECAEALAAGEGKILIEGGPALHGGRVGGGDLGKAHPLPAAEIDLPKVGVDVAGVRSAKGNFSRLAGPPERAAEEMRPVSRLTSPVRAAA